MTAQDTHIQPSLAEFPADVLNAAAEAVEVMPHRAPFKADVLFAIARAILAERQRDQWQPIDEKTPHHQNVLVWREDAGEPWVAQYTDETFFDAEAGDSDRMDWFDLAGRYEGAEAPTHWRPLPASPKGGEA